MARTHLSLFLVVIKTASKSHCCPVEIHAAILSFTSWRKSADKIMAPLNPVQMILHSVS
jgi:hypothetical protein